jgi:hypothetical protein
LLVIVLVAVAGLRIVCPFLAITKRVPTDTLVVDGWLPTYDLNQVPAVYRAGGYQRLLVVRGVYDFEAVDNDRGNANYVTRVLVKHGVPAAQLNSVLFPGLRIDRTFGSAEAVKEWYRQHGLPLVSLDLATLGPHARRSRLLYQKAFGPGVEVGVIALDDPAYDPRRWWRSSEGVREVLFEFVAYIYVRFSFSPPQLSGLHLLPPTGESSVGR